MKTFSQRVLECALAIPKGRVTTYGLIARAAGGGPMAAQSITHILSKAYNNGETRIPFHRIVYSNGKIWTHSKYNAERKKLYQQEGITLNEKNIIANFQDILFEFK